jgi:hypothetical protein
VSVTPLELDLTDHDALARAQERVPDPTGPKLAADVR